jgi:hypothetical protein
MSLHSKDNAKDESRIILSLIVNYKLQIYRVFCGNLFLKKIFFLKNSHKIIGFESYFFVI